MERTQLLAILAIGALLTGVASGIATPPTNTTPPSTHALEPREEDMPTSGPLDPVEQACRDVVTAVLGPEQAHHTCATQYDGDAHGDASDVCSEPQAERTYEVLPLPPGEELLSTTGAAIAQFGDVDNYHFIVHDPGIILEITLDSQPLYRQIDPAPGVVDIETTYAYDHIYTLKRVIVEAGDCEEIQRAPPSGNTTSDAQSFGPLDPGLYALEIIPVPSGSTAELSDAAESMPVSPEELSSPIAESSPDQRRQPAAVHGAEGVQIAQVAQDQTCHLMCMQMYNQLIGYRIGIHLG